MLSLRYRLRLVMLLTPRSEQAKSFRALNLEVEHLQSLSPAEQFWEVIDALGDIEGPMQQYHGDIILGGDLWQRMASLAGESIDEQVEKLREMNTIMSDSQIEQGLIFEANTNRMQSALTGISNTITQFLYPHFNILSDVGASAMQAIATAIYGGGEEGEGGLGVLPALQIMDKAFNEFWMNLSPNARTAAAGFAASFITGLNQLGPKVVDIARGVEKAFKTGLNAVLPHVQNLVNAMITGLNLLDRLGGGPGNEAHIQFEQLSLVSDIGDWQDVNLPVQVVAALQVAHEDAGGTGLHPQIKAHEATRAANRRSNIDFAQQQRALARQEALNRLGTPGVTPGHHLPLQDYTTWGRQMDDDWMSTGTGMFGGTWEDIQASSGGSWVRFNRRRFKGLASCLFSDSCETAVRTCITVTRRFCACQSCCG